MKTISEEFRLLFQLGNSNALNLHASTNAALGEPCLPFTISSFVICAGRRLVLFCHLPRVTRALDSSDLSLLAEPEAILNFYSYPSILCDINIPNLL